MPHPGSITRLLDQLKDGDADAAASLWNRYFSQIVKLARAQLVASVRRAADEEDIALSAFHSFCQNAQQGRFPSLLDRGSLWRLLLTLTKRKAADLVRHERAQKRGGGKIDNDAQQLDQIVSIEPTPDEAAVFADEFRTLLKRLDDSELQLIAVRKMEGHNNEEIAAELGCVPRTIERRLHVIRSIWVGANL